MAQDRLWQMDLIKEDYHRTPVGGSRSFTGGCRPALSGHCNFQKKSEWSSAETDPEILACVEAFADGVNQFIEQHQKKLPFEFTLLGYKPDPWKTEHTFNLIGYMAWDLASGWGTEMALYKMQQVLEEARFQELLPDMDYQEYLCFPRFDAAQEKLLNYNQAWMMPLRSLKISDCRYLRLPTTGLYPEQGVKPECL